MESTLFTTLTATEEANLSGGTKSHKPKKDKYTPVIKKYPVVKIEPVSINVKIFTNVIAGIDNDGNTQVNQG